MKPEDKTTIYKQVFYDYTLRNCLSYTKPHKTDLTYNDLKGNSADLAKKLKGLFNVINLEPEKQEKANGQDLHFTYNKRTYSTVF